MSDDKLVRRSLVCEAEMGALFRALLDRPGLTDAERLAVAELLFTHLRRQATPEQLSASDAIVQRRTDQWRAAEREVIAFAEKLRRN